MMSQNGKNLLRSADLFSATSSLIWFHTVCKRTDRVGERKKLKHDRTVKKETKKGGGWTDEGKKTVFLMCLGLVRSDSDGGRERKVKPKVAIIYLLIRQAVGERAETHTFLTLFAYFLHFCLVFPFFHSQTQS